MSLVILALMIIPQKLSNSSLSEKGIKGEIHHDKWVNFAHNRNCALQHAQGKTDYVLIFDADDRFEGTFELPEELTSDRYISAWQIV